MSGKEFSRREFLYTSGSLSLAVGSGLLTATLLDGCSDDTGGTLDKGTSVDDGGYSVPKTHDAQRFGAVEV